MNEQESLLEVVELLSTYPDVVVLSYGVESHKYVIRVTCKRMAVLSRIAEWVMEGANQPMSIQCSGAPQLGPGGRFTATDIHFLIEVERLRRKNEGCTYLEILGIHLVWDLKAMKKITARRANNLLRACNGAIR